MKRMRTLNLWAADVVRGSLVLVNADHPVRRAPTVDELVAVRADMPHIRLERQAAGVLAQMTSLVGCEQEIVPVSGYRPLQEQEQIYAASLREHGEEFTKQYVALPGCSEHQTGLAIDLGQNQGTIDFIRPALPYTGIFGKFREAALRGGFIERYPAGRERITGIAHEPWHFRYVGHPHAVIMRDEGLTLEEYTDYLGGFGYDGPHLRRQSQGRDFEIFYVPIPCTGGFEIEMPEEAAYDVSGNNVDGVIVTLLACRA